MRILITSSGWSIAVVKKPEAIPERALFDDDAVDSTLVSEGRSDSPADRRADL
jgi:hypothetical protein